MRGKLLSLCLAILVLCSGCTVPAAQTEAPPEGEYELWFVSSVRSQDGESWGAVDSGALDREFHALTGEGEPVEELINLLLSGPKGEGLTSPFPQGTVLRSWYMEEGRITLDLSEAYSGLVGVEQTLADGCIVLTLCQLSGAEEVYITVEGRRRPFRDRVYTRQDFIENNRFDLLPDIEAGAFSDGTGEGEALDRETTATSEG